MDKDTVLIALATAAALAKIADESIQWQRGKIDAETFAERAADELERVAPLLRPSISW